MKSLKTFVLVLCLTLLSPGLMGNVTSAGEVINGAGASFPYPVYSQWIYKYNRTTGIKFNYQSIGSGGGIAQIKANTVDFGASDAPLTKEDLDQSGLFQFPMVMGGVVPVVNIPGVDAGKLKLDAQTLTGILLGKITRWNDPAITGLNADLTLPDQVITVVHRSDGSGTTWIFTNYLDKISSQWHERVGTGKAVDWPTGVGGKGNEGVSAYVQQTSGSIGYVEFAYALQNKMAHVLLQNKAGKLVGPTIESFQAAAANADWTTAPGFYLVLTDQPGAESWPITGATFILLHKKQMDAQKIKTILTFFDWAYKHGGPIAEKLHYVPMPAAVVNLVEAAWKTELSADGGSVW